MVKQQRRKPKRRPILDEKVDEKAELAELAELLFEHKLDGNAANWLTLPWRSGWNAIGLALDVAGVSVTWHKQTNWLNLLLEGMPVEPAAYLIADEYLLEVCRNGYHEQGIRAALRCLQMMIAKSDGAGHNFNHALQAIHEAIASEQMIKWRAFDALNYDHRTLITPAVERGRRAFTIAWRRGLFHAAYALPPVNAGVIKR